MRHPTKKNCREKTQALDTDVVLGPGLREQPLKACDVLVREAKLKGVLPHVIGRGPVEWLAHGLAEWIHLCFLTFPLKYLQDGTRHFSITLFVGQLTYSSIVFFYVVRFLEPGPVGSFLHPIF